MRSGNENLDIADWVKLRFTIILLGEIHSWWPSNVISGKGVEFLSYILPKTKESAAFQLATEICRLEHDTHIGPARYHIFRLSQKSEEQIFNNLMTCVRAFKILPESELMKELFRLSEGVTVTPVKGPILVGTISELNDRSVYKSFARYYFDAFKEDYKTYPYLN